MIQLVLMLTGVQRYFHEIFDDASITNLKNVLYPMSNQMFLMVIIK